MSTFAAKLCNPTPWTVELNYDRGVVLVVPAFGSAKLTPNQENDYRPDKPGSEAVALETDMLGVFLLDIDLSYEKQALDALRKSRRAKDSMRNETLQNHRNRAATQGISPDDETFKRVEDLMGMNKLKEQIETLDKLIAKYESVVTEQEQRRSLRRQLDPARTVFAINPPREFDSAVARQFFLDENPEIAEKEASIRSQMEAAEAGE